MLEDAVKDNDTEAMERILGWGGCTAQHMLIMAVSVNADRALGRLLELGIAQLAKTRNLTPITPAPTPGCTANLSEETVAGMIQAAASINDPFILDRALECGATLEPNLLVRAVMANSDAIVRRLLALGIDPNYIGEARQPVLALWATGGALANNDTPEYRETGLALLRGGANPLMGHDGVIGNRYCAQSLAGRRSLAWDVLQQFKAEQDTGEMEARTQAAAGAKRRRHRLYVA